MRGTKPAPTAIKIAKGTQKHRIAKGEPPLIAGEAEIPAHFDEVARAEWARLVGDLKRIGIYSAAHAGAIAVYCQAYSDWIDAERHIKEEGKTVTNTRGVMQLSPYVRIARDAMLLMCKLIVEFGLTPSASTRIASSVAAAPKDDLENFLSLPG